MWWAKFSSPRGPNYETTFLNRLQVFVIIWFPTKDWAEVLYMCVLMHACVCTHSWACRNPVCSVVLFSNHQDFHISSGTYFWGSLNQRSNFWDSFWVYFFLPAPHFIRGLWSWEKLHKCVDCWDSSKELSHSVWVSTKVDYLGLSEKYIKSKGSLCYSLNSSLTSVHKAATPVFCAFPWNPKFLLKSPPHRDIFQPMLVLLHQDPAQVSLRMAVVFSK